MTERDFLADVQAALEYRRQEWGNQFPEQHQEKVRHAKKVQKAGITTYDAAYAVLGDVWANVKLRHSVAVALELIAHMGRWKRPRRQLIDRRKIAPAVLIALQSKDSSLQYAAIDIASDLRLKRAVPILMQLAPTHGWALRALGDMDDPRVIPLLDKIANNRALENHHRINAVIALSDLYPVGGDQIPAILHRIMIDTTDHPEIRALAAEWLGHMAIAETITSYIHLLSDPNVELRFWAAFGLVTMGQTLDISAAIALIDHTVAYDTAVLPRWWSVASEAIPAFEGYWYRRLGGCEDGSYCSSGVMLISPLLEYDDLRRAGQHINFETAHYEYSIIEQSTTLSIDPTAFAKQISEHWPTAKINVRHPQPEALILDWWMEGKESPLMGALHRNGYWIFLLGDESETLPFILWLREIIASEYLLRIYYWADVGIEINATLGEIGFSEAERRAREAWNESVRQAEAELKYWAKWVKEQS